MLNDEAETGKNTKLETGEDGVAKAGEWDAARKTRGGQTSAVYMHLKFKAVPREVFPKGPT